MSDSAAGWHPDPFGRFSARYWDGGQWTEHVATGDQVSKDPPATTPSAGPASVPEVVGAADLAFGYGVGVTQWKAVSTDWPVIDRQGRSVATMSAQGGLDRLKSLHVTAADGRRVLTVGPGKVIGNANRPLLDGWGRQFGELHPMQQQVQFSTPEGLCGSGVTQNLSGIYTHCEFAGLSDAQGNQLGRVVNHAPRWPSHEIAGWPGADPRYGWLLLQRHPDLAEPLRSFFLAYPVLLAWHWLEWKRYTLDGTSTRTSPEHL